jgi:hypothetical protein
MKLLRFLFVLCSIFLASCQSMSSNVGSGSIRLSPSVQAVFKKYLANPDSSYFAVSADGRYAGYSYCPFGKAVFHCEDSHGYGAIKVCNGEIGRGCKIYAERKKIVWVDASSDGAWGPIKTAPARKARATGMVQTVAGSDWTKADVDAELHTCQIQCEKPPSGNSKNCKNVCACYVTALQQHKYSKINAYNAARKNKGSIDREFEGTMVLTMLQCKREK